MQTLTLDAQLLLLINHGTANPLFDILMPLFSNQGYLLVIPFLIYMLLQGALRKNEQGKRYIVTAISGIAIACIAVYLSDWVEHLLKNAIARPRPCSTIDRIRLIVPCPQSFSMPSGHASSSFAFSVPLAYMTQQYLSKKWRAYPLVLAALIAVSRLYLGVHYPTDVLIGALLGALIGLVFSLLYQPKRVNALFGRYKTGDTNARPQ